MNFERFDKTNSTSPRNPSVARPATLRMKGRTFFFTKKLAERMGLKAGQGLAFLYDKTENQWFLQRDDENGLPLMEIKFGGVKMQSVQLSKRVAATLPNGMRSAIIDVAEEPIEVEDIKMWALITSTATAPPERQKKDTEEPALQD